MRSLLLDNVNFKQLVFRTSHARLRARCRVLEVMQMSEILSNVLDSVSVEDSVWLPASESDKARMQRVDDENFLKHDMRALLVAPVISYCGITDEALYKYLKGAVQRFQHLQALRALAYCAADEDGRIERYLREMRRCNQVICRIRREFARRAAVKGRRE